MTRALLLAAALGAARGVAAQQPRDSAPPVPASVHAAFAGAPLADGDGALFVTFGRDSAAVAVGTGVADSTNAATVCTVARLRAERELVRLLVGLRLDSRIVLGTSERTGAAVHQQFGETITETVAGRLAGAALGAQWWVDGPRRCRVGLWIGARPAATPPR